MRINDLKRLFEKAGKAEAIRRAVERGERAARARLIKRTRLQQLEADARAPQAAERVWRWLEGPNAKGLGALLHASGLAEVMLLQWITAEGRLLRSPYYGAWSVSLPAKRRALCVRCIGSPAGGGRSRLVDSVAGLLNTAPSHVVLALDEGLGSDRYLRTVCASLRERTLPDA